MDSLEVGEGNWPSQLEEEYGELEATTQEVLLENLAQVRCLAVPAEDVIV